MSNLWNQYYIAFLEHPAATKGTAATKSLMFILKIPQVFSQINWHTFVEDTVD